MRASNKLAGLNLEENYLSEILPVFTQDLPQKVLETHNAVPMDLCMATLMITSIIKGSIQEAVKVIDEKKKSFAFTHSPEDLPEDFDWDAIHYAHPNDIRKTLIAWPRSQIASGYRKVNRELIRELKKSRFFQKMHGKDGMTAAFDVTQVDYYGAEDNFTLFTHGRSAAKRCHAYLSLQIVCPGFRLVLDVEPIFKDTKPLGKIMSKMLRRMRRYGLKFKNIYLDRGFYQIDVLKALRQHFHGEQGKTLMPVIRSNRVKKAIEEWHKTNSFKAGMLEMKLGDEKDGEDYFLIFAPLKIQERAKLRKKKVNGIHNYYLYFCLLKPPDASNESIEDVFTQLSYNYRGRWGIETGYRVVKTIWGWTTSTEYTLRLWLMWNAIMIYNLWVMTNLALIEKKGVPDEYFCCEKVSLERIEEERRIREQRKYPAWARASKTPPKRPWKPRSVIILREFNWAIEYIAMRLINQVLTSGYDPPKFYLEEEESEFR